MDYFSAKMRELTLKKDSIENEIKYLNGVLISENNIGMSGSLLDEEQFPRNDIDICTVRQTRNKILCLNNDHKSLMKEIEACLYDIHKTASKNKKCNLETKIENIESIPYGEPFALIGKVEPNSPADIGGLKTGDHMIEFGSLKKSNYSSIEDFSKVTKHSQGNPLNLKIMRDGRPLSLSLTPNTWSGPGLLGCKVLPVRT